jgi:hypothetical protein
VRNVIAAAVTQIDAADVGNVELRPARMAEDHELLVVRAPGAHPHVQHHLSPVYIDVLGERAVLLRAELEAIKMRPPDQPLHLDT